MFLFIRSGVKTDNSGHTSAPLLAFHYSRVMAGGSGVKREGVGSAGSYKSFCFVVGNELTNDLADQGNMIQRHENVLWPAVLPKI
jgi:hypothetical protein